MSVRYFTRTGTSGLAAKASYPVLLFTVLTLPHIQPFPPFDFFSTILLVGSFHFFIHFRLSYIELSFSSSWFEMKYFCWRQLNLLTDQFRIMPTRSALPKSISVVVFS